jgi:hypothetical protein
MRYERTAAAHDDGVNYADGDVVYGGTSQTESSEQFQMMTLWSPALCEVSVPRLELSPANLTNPHRIKDCDNSDSIEHIMDDVDQYLDTEYPTHQS